MKNKEYVHISHFLLRHIISVLFYINIRTSIRNWHSSLCDLGYQLEPWWYPDLFCYQGPCQGLWSKFNWSLCGYPWPILSPRGTPPYRSESLCCSLRPWYCLVPACCQEPSLSPWPSWSHSLWWASWLLLPLKTVMIEEPRVCPTPHWLQN